MMMMMQTMKFLVLGGLLGVGAMKDLQSGTPVLVPGRKGSSYRENAVVEAYWDTQRGYKIKFDNPPMSKFVHEDDVHDPRRYTGNATPVSTLNQRLVHDVLQEMTGQGVPTLKDFNKKAQALARRTGKPIRILKSADDFQRNVLLLYMVKKYNSEEKYILWASPKALSFLNEYADGKPGWKKITFGNNPFCCHLSEIQFKKVLWEVEFQKRRDLARDVVDHLRQDEAKRGRTFKNDDDFQRKVLLFYVLKQYKKYTDNTKNVLKGKHQRRKLNRFARHNLHLASAWKNLGSPQNKNQGCCVITDPELANAVKTVYGKRRRLSSMRRL